MGWPWLAIGYSCRLGLLGLARSGLSAGECTGSLMSYWVMFLRVNSTYFMETGETCYDDLTDKIRGASRYLAHQMTCPDCDAQKHLSITPT